MPRRVELLLHERDAGAPEDIIALTAGIESLQEAPDCSEGLQQRGPPSASPPRIHERGTLGVKTQYR